MPSSESDSSSRPSTRSTGRRHEQQAAEYFQKQGFEILERNLQVGHLEIDLIVRQLGLLVFVEVKSASNLKFGHPAEKVDRRKINRLVRAAQRYLQDHSITGCDLRFDVITFVGGKLEHFPAAFDAS
jgi:putative endonuclease